MNKFDELFDLKKWTCSICGKVVTPIFITLDKDDISHQYCSDHNPVTQEERHKMWGVTPDMLKPRERRGRPVGIK